MIKPFNTGKFAALGEAESDGGAIMGEEESILRESLSRRTLFQRVFEGLLLRHVAPFLPGRSKGILTQRFQRLSGCFFIRSARQEGQIVAESISQTSLRIWCPFPALAP